MEFLQVSSLTTGIDEFVGNGNANIINAGVVNATSGAAETTINSGDSIDGGAGTDTLNITATKANNASITGLTVKNVEVINITGSDWIGASSTTTTAASNSAAVAQVDSINISSPTVTAEVHTINFGDLTVDAKGKISIGDATATEISGTAALLTAEIAAGANASTIAAAVAKALTDDAAATTPVIDNIATAVAVGNVVTVTYDTKITNGALYNATDGLLKLAAPATDAATFVSTNVTSGYGASGLGLVTVAGSTNTAAVSVTIDGTQYAAGNVSVGVTGTTANVMSSVASIKAAGEVAAKNAAVTLIAAKLNEVNGGSLTAAAGDENGELLITSDYAGNALPTVTIAQGAANLGTADASDTQAKTNVVKKLTTGAVKEQVTLTLTNVQPSETLDLFIGGASYGTLTAGSTDTDSTMATALAAAVNGVLGTGTAVAVGTSVVITAPTAGTVLPDVTVDTAPAVTFASATGVNGTANANYLKQKGLDATLISGTGSFASNASLTAAEATTINNALIALDEVVEAQTRANAVEATSTSTTAYADAAIAATSFVGAEQIWLKGDSNSTNVSALAAGQTLGLNGVTSAANEAAWGATVAAGNLAVSASGGALEVSGTKLATLNISGTGTAGAAGLAITEGTTTKVLSTVNADMSGAAYLNLSGLTKLTTVTSTGKGGLTVNANTAIKTITTGEGADRVTISLVTSKDNEATVTDETLSAQVTTGGGADTVKVNTSGTGTTTVVTGEGNDTVYFDGIGSGLNVIELGAGNDTIYRGASSATTTVDGGAGTDTLVRGATSYTAASYISDNAVYSNMEALTFTGAVTVDMSKLSIGDVETITLLAGSNASSNTLTEVTQKVNISGRYAVTTASADGAIPTNSASGATGADVASLGFEAGSASIATDFGGDLTIVVDDKAGDTVALDLNAAKATVTVGVGVISTNDADTVPDTTVAGNLQNLAVNLVSFQATGSTAVTLAASSIGKEYIATIAADVGVVSGTSQATNGLNNLQSITVAGQGAVTIDAKTANPLTGVANTTSQLTALTDIDVSGMTALARVNYLGLQVTNSAHDSTTYGYKNLSTTSITLNPKVAETLKLGGAEDTIVTSSTIAAIDSITGFELSAKVSDTTVVDLTKSDVLELGSFTYNAATAFFTKLTDTYATMNAGLTAAAAETSAYVAFHADGATYVYIDLASGGTSVAGLDDGDLLVELVGTLDLDLLIQEGVIV